MHEVNDAENRGWDEPPDDHDEEIMHGVREAWSVADPAPGFLVDQVRLALGLVDLDAEVLRLIESQQPVAARGERTRRITFSDDELTIMISVDSNADGTARLDGWLAPGAPCRIELAVAAQHLTADSDEDGRFAMVRAPRGMARLVVHQVATRSRTVTTPTFEL